MAKRFCGNGFALVKPATRYSSSARTAIADIATAASHAACKPAADSGVPLISATSKASKANSIIAIASGSTVAVSVKCN